MAKLIDADKLRKDVPLWLDGAVLVMPVEALDEAPEVDAEPVIYAHWIKIKELCGIDVLKCSHCLEEHPSKRTPYCPYCGAKMNKENKNG